MDTVAAKHESFPLLSWTGLISSVCIAIGLYWDISWHEAIGRDTFWTPAHLMIQFGAVLTGCVAGWVIMRATFGGDSAARQASVNVLGFRGPLGAFVSAWGGVAMITSAPFDNWWHNAYGLDVKIISPPHMLLALGIAGINWGAALGTIAEMNRSQGDDQRRMLQRVLLALGGFVVLQSMILKLEYTNRVLLHSGISYLVVSIGLLLVLEGMARATGHRWARTIITGVYSIFVLLMLWILPLFPAQPKLGPVYQQITHFVPLPWPLLLIVPAFVLDLLTPYLSRRPRWQHALVGGISFLVVLVAVQWPFATFLMSPAARTWFFAPPDYPYFAVPSSPTVRHVFVTWEKTQEWFWRNMALAAVASALSLWLGMNFGDWLRKLRR